MKVMKAMASNMDIQSFDFVDTLHPGTFSTYGHSMQDKAIIAAAFSSTTTLKKLRFSAEYPSKEIYDALHRNTSITSLTIYNSSLPSSGLFLPQNVVELEIFYWKHNRNEHEYQNLVLNILNNNTLRVLKLKNGTDDINQTLDFISPILRDKINIETLVLEYDARVKLSDNNINNIARSALTTLEITNGSPTLHNELNINIFEHLVSAIANNNNIENLVLKNWKMGAYGNENILQLSLAAANLISNCHSIRELTLVGFKFDDVCGTNIINSLKNSQTRQLTSLDLSYNAFSARTLKKFTQFNQFQKLVLGVEPGYLMMMARLKKRMQHIYQKMII